MRYNDWFVFHFCRFIFWSNISVSSAKCQRKSCSCQRCTPSDASTAYNLSVRQATAFRRYQVRVGVQEHSRADRRTSSAPKRAPGERVKRPVCSRPPGRRGLLQRQQTQDPIICASVNEPGEIMDQAEMFQNWAAQQSGHWTQGLLSTWKAEGATVRSWVLCFHLVTEWAAAVSTGQVQATHERTRLHLETRSRGWWSRSRYHDEALPGPPEGWRHSPGISYLRGSYAQLGWSFIFPKLFTPADNTGEKYVLSQPNSGVRGSW